MMIITIVLLNLYNYINGMNYRSFMIQFLPFIGLIFKIIITWWSNFEIFRSAEILKIWALETFLQIYPK